MTSSSLEQDDYWTMHRFQWLMLSRLFVELSTHTNRGSFVVLRAATAMIRSPHSCWTRGGDIVLPEPTPSGAALLCASTLPIGLPTQQATQRLGTFSRQPHTLVTKLFV
jgi:hypothetical protein